MKELMRDESKPFQICLPGTHGPSAGHEAHRIPVLDASTRFNEQIQQDVFIGIGQPAPEFRLLMENLLDVGGCSRCVPETIRSVVAVVYQNMRNSAELKF